MYGRIVSALIAHATTEEGSINVDLEDAIMGASVVTHEGKVRFEG
jgi:NAD/NADP transhydrogenase alpha subunit